MRREIGRWIAVFALAGAPGAFAQGGTTIDRGDGAVVGDEPDVNYTEVIVGLIEKLGKTKTEAQDASVKLSRLGSRALPMLADLVAKTDNAQVKFYAAYSLSLMKDPAAGKALMPILKDPNADKELRKLAMQATRGGQGTMSVGELVRIAQNPEEDSDLRFMALKELSVKIESFADLELLFVDALGYDRDDIRQLAAKQCFQAATTKVIYLTAEPKLVEMAEKDAVFFCRSNAIAALARMKSRMAVPALLRILADEKATPQLKDQALNGLKAITQIPFVSIEKAKAWADNGGAKPYESAKPLLADEAAAKYKEELQKRMKALTGEAAAPPPPPKEGEGEGAAPATPAGPTEQPGEIKRGQ